MASSSQAVSEYRTEFQQPLRITETVKRELSSPRWRNPNDFIPSYRNDHSNLHNNPVRRLSASNYARYESLSKTLKKIGRGSEKLRLTGTMIAGIKKFEEDERIYEELREQEEQNRVLTLQAALVHSYNRNKEARKEKKKKEHEMRKKEKELMQSEEAISRKNQDHIKVEKTHSDDYNDDFEPGMLLYHHPTACFSYVTKYFLISLSLSYRI